MKKTVEKDLRFNNNLTFWSLWVIIVTVFICQTIVNVNLRVEIDSMPHYECWDELINTTKPQLNNGWYYAEENTCTEGYLIKTKPIVESFDEGLIVKSTTHSETCIIPPTKEVCKLNKNDVLLGADE